MAVRILPSGTRALLVEVTDTATATAWYRAVQRRRDAGELPQVSDLVPAARTVLVHAEPGTDLAALGTQLQGITPIPVSESPEASEAVVVPVRYDGPDLADAAGALGLEPDQLVGQHQDEIWTVAFGGFAPGFGYLTGRRFEWDVPRLASPRDRVPAGSVALAGPYTGVYPTASPGGWHLIGHTEMTIFDAEHDPPAVLRPGVSVRFQDAT